MKRQNHNTVKFVSTLPGVADIFPIRPMSDYKPDWANKARAEYKKLDSASRKRAINVFKLKHGGELPDYTNIKDVAKLNAYADLKP